MTIDLLHHSPILNGSNRDSRQTWIGLFTPAAATNYIWSDASDFDFASNLSSYPWHHSLTTSSTPNHVHILSESDDYKWQNTDGSAAIYQQSLCNSCDSKFSKFIGGGPASNTWADAETWCNSHYGTNLASIHSMEDFEEAALITSIFNDDCWIGMNDRVDEGTFVWTDGTSWDFATDLSGGVYPWSADQPDNTLGDEDCVEILVAGNLRLNDANCESGGAGFALCNMPSELCFRSYWNELLTEGGNGVAWTGVNNVMKCDLQMDGGQVMMVMNGKQWVNHRDVLRIHYMFNIEAAVDGQGDSGVLVNYVDACHYYYIGVAVKDGVYSFFVKKNVDGQVVELAVMEDIAWTMGVYEQLEVDIRNASIFKVSMNGQWFVVYDDEVVEQKKDNLFSGYIGVKNNGLTVTAKSLFVSGSTVYLEDDGVVEEFGKCPMEIPTPEPTVSVSMQATPISPSGTGDEVGVTETTETVVVTGVYLMTQSEYAIEMAVGAGTLLFIVFSVFMIFCQLRPKKNRGDEVKSKSEFDDVILPRTIKVDPTPMHSEPGYAVPTKEKLSKEQHVETNGNTPMIMISTHPHGDSDEFKTDSDFDEIHAVQPIDGDDTDDGHDPYGHGETRQFSMGAKTTSNIHVHGYEHRDEVAPMTPPRGNRLNPKQKRGKKKRSK
eukprot:CAMPEP_0197073404 /NCGR_PEP_ID=MMETSP1384-20130603/210590_1 /TAXON_ID=29189 /ORGANISM="Ammonia sp." /LENGTH=661 /DNA_ID=CAMNT_0042512241 /DNA_START=579 /DNA_END=2564 /DNA_ORIENTATION=-